MKRYQKAMVYTFVGDVLVSVNPFKKLNIYDESVSLPITFIMSSLISIGRTIFPSTQRRTVSPCVGTAHPTSMG